MVRAKNRGLPDSSEHKWIILTWPLYRPRPRINNVKADAAICSVWPDVPVGYSESDYKKPICKVRVQCTRSLASEYKLDTEPAFQLHLEHYIGDEDISETD